MPPYQPVAENAPVKLLLRGVPGYAFGHRLNSFRFQVTSVAVAANVVTLGVLLLEGLLPTNQNDLVGTLISVVGTSTDSGAANIQNAAITAISINTSTGVGTITYAATAGNQSTTSDSGQAVIKNPEVGETAANGKSQAFAIQNTIGAGYGITWSFVTPTAPGALSVQLEGAISDVDSQYSIIGSAQSSPGQVVAQLPNLVNFVRLRQTGLSGSGTVIGKLLLS